MADTPAKPPDLSLEEMCVVVKKLRENNIPPCVCPKCGTSFYMWVPATGEWIEPKVPVLCDDCER